MATYPGAIKTFTAQVDNVDDAEAADVNVVYDEVTAIQTELGTNPKASATDLKTRLAHTLNALGYLSFDTPTELTIASGSITTTQTFHRVDTQADASSDDLDNITIPATGDNQFRLLRIEDDSRNVRIRHGFGNIYCLGGQAITLDTTNDIAVVMYDTSQSHWIAYGVTQAGLLGANNAWTGTNTFTGAMAFPYLAVIANLTLDATHYTIDAVVTGGSITVTLPSAATCTGRVYNIRKSDASVYTVTIAAAGGETINGDATKVISAQYDVITIQSTGVVWAIL